MEDPKPTPEMERALLEFERKNYGAALRLLTPLAEAGNPEAECNLATLYQCGLGVQMDAQKAVSLYRKVAEQNIRERCVSGIAYNNLATLYAIGAPGVERDRELAKKYRQLARELGFNM